MDTCPTYSLSPKAKPLIFSYTLLFILSLNKNYEDIQRREAIIFKRNSNFRAQYLDNWTSDRDSKTIIMIVRSVLPLVNVLNGFEILESRCFVFVYVATQISNVNKHGISLIVAIRVSWPNFKNLLWPWAENKPRS